MIAKYKAEGGIKNLAWVTSYVEKSKDQEITDTHIQKGFFYSGEILKMNGFDSNQFDTKTEAKVLEGLLEESYTTFGIDPKTQEVKIENTKIPQLTKYYYMKATQSTTDRNILEGSMEAKLDLQKDNLNKALGSGASSDPAVKVENPKYLDMKQEMNIAQSMKSSLEKIFNSTDIMFKDLQAENKPEIKPLVKQMEPVLKEANNFIETVRKLLAECKSLDTSAEESLLKKKSKELSASSAAGSHHIDGLKSLKKRLQAMA